MSRKSRQRRPEAGAPGRKGSAGGRAGAAPGAAVRTTEHTTEQPTKRAGRVGVPFGVVVLLAAVMSMPTILSMASQAMSFDAGITRLLIALGVAWLLTTLVTSVIDGMRPDVPPIERAGPSPFDQPHPADQARMPSPGADATDAEMGLRATGS